DLIILQHPVPGEPVRQPEIRQAHASIEPDEHVRRRHVPMHQLRRAPRSQLAPVHSNQRRQERVPHHRDDPVRDRRALPPAPPLQLGEGEPHDVLPRDERPRLGLPPADDARDRRVRAGRLELSFPQQRRALFHHVGEGLQGLQGEQRAVAPAHGQPAPRLAALVQDLHPPIGPPVPLLRVPTSTCHTFSGPARLAMNPIARGWGALPQPSPRETDTHLSEGEAPRCVPPRVRPRGASPGGHPRRPSRTQTSTPLCAPPRGPFLGGESAPKAPSAGPLRDGVAALPAHSSRRLRSRCLRIPSPLPWRASDTAARAPAWARRSRRSGGWTSSWASAEWPPCTGRPTATAGARPSRSSTRPSRRSRSSAIGSSTKPTPPTSSTTRAPSPCSTTACAPTDRCTSSWSCSRARTSTPA